MRSARKSQRPFFGNRAASGGADCAFTLTELLVAVAIIAILASLLLPGIAKAKGQGTKALCINNFKQLQLAWQMYCDDNNGVLPWNNLSGPLTGVPGGLNWVGGWMTPIYELGDPRDNTNVQLLIKVEGGIGQYLRDPRIFKCPSDQSLTKIDGKLHPRVRSVAMNGYLSGQFQGEPILLPAAMAYGRLSILAARPPIESGWVFVDTHEDSISTGQFYPQRPDASPTGWVHFPGHRHNGGATVSFVDGHVVSHRWSDDRTKQPVTGFSMYGRVQAGNRDCRWLNDRSTVIKK